MFFLDGMGSLGNFKDFLNISTMDATWREEKLTVLLEKVDRQRVNGLGCYFYDVNLAQTDGVGGISMVGLKLHIQMVHVKFY